MQLRILQNWNIIAVWAEESDHQKEQFSFDKYSCIINSLPNTKCSYDINLE